MLHRSSIGICCLLLAPLLVRADDPYPVDSQRGKSSVGGQSNYQPPYFPIAPAAASILFDRRMPLTALLPAVYIENLCSVRYRATTKSVECQKFIDQGLGYYYSYVWMEAARSFETALSHDPTCAFAWLGLARSFEKWDKTPKANKALEKSKELRDKAGPREQLLITAKLQEKGMLPGVAPDERKKKAAQTLDELLTLYEDDEEGWFARAQINGGTEGAVYYKALLKHNPIHPGASHELVHFFENFKRPALGWPYALAYMESSPRIPHAFHMQAHLATRIGKWDRTTDWSARAVELQREYHRVQNVNPKDDHQFSHHLEILMTCLLHDGRDAEARAVKEDIVKLGLSFQQPFMGLAIADQNWEEAEKLVAKSKRGDKTQQAHQFAMLALEQGDTGKASSQIEVLQTAQRQKKGDKQTEIRVNTAQGWYLCQTGNSEAGLKMLKRAVDKTKADYSHHSWGRGASIMEIWGVAALQGGNASEAEEAFLEALAHDAGSAKSALGLFALCQKLDRLDEADRYLKLAKRLWARADSIVFERTLASMILYASHVSKASSATISERPKTGETGGN